MLRFMEESLDAYFAMPAEQYPELLQQLVAGLDKALQRYVTQTVSPCGGYYFRHSLNERWSKFYWLNTRCQGCVTKLVAE